MPPVRGGSTGLHIAAAMDVPTVGFFPAHPFGDAAALAAAQRRGRHLPFSPPEDSDHPEDMSQLDPKAMAAEIAAGRRRSGAPRAERANTVNADRAPRGLSRHGSCRRAARVLLEAYLPA